VKLVPTHPKAGRIRRAVRSHVEHPVHGMPREMTEYLSQTLAIPNGTRGVEPGRAPSTRLSRKARMLLSFQRPSRPVGKGLPSKGRSPRAEALEPKFLGAGPSSLAPLGAGCGLRVRPDVPAPLSESIRIVRSRASRGQLLNVAAPVPSGRIPCESRVSALQSRMQAASRPVLGPRSCPTSRPQR
jgi:hypothetical protein